ncbi:tetratricopeptide repeat protein [Candidatus Saccharibacteria bacterium]|nr:tetratricopeptide repeat protein [Candidatus Saccharibacteria bacterium]
MLGIILILIFCVYLAFLFPIKKKEAKKEKKDPKFDSQMKKLWSIAQTSMKNQKLVRAEKALLTILKFDEKNAAAYNRLGILYAKEKRYDEAIECFEIAQSLDNNASSLHNVGLIYLETGAYEKAAMAFRQALELEGDLPARHIALAKAEEKIGNRKAAIEALEAAFDLDHSTSTLRQILAIYESMEDSENITATTARIEEQIAKNAAKKATAKPRTRRIIRRNSTGKVKRPVKASSTRQRTSIARQGKTATKRPTTSRTTAKSEPTKRTRRKII